MYCIGYVMCFPKRREMEGRRDGNKGRTVPTLPSILYTDLNRNDSIKTIADALIISPVMF